MPRFLGKHPSEPERSSVDTLTDVDITSTTPSGSDNLLVYDTGSGKYIPGNASSGGGTNISTPADTENFDDGALLGSDSTLARIKKYDKSTGNYSPATGSVTVNITIDGSTAGGFTTSDTITEAADKLNELIFNIKNNTYVKHAKFIAREGAAASSAITGQANIGQTIYFHFPASLFNNGTDGNADKCDVLDWGDGSSAENDITMTAESDGGGGKYVSHQYNSTFSGGSGYSVKIRLYNSSAIVGTFGSSVCFELVDMLTSYTALPVPVLQYQYTQKDSSTIGYASTSPASVDEDDGANAGTTVPISMKITDSVSGTIFHYYAVKFTPDSGAAVYYPTGAASYYTSTTPSDITSNWQQCTDSTTPIEETFSQRLDFLGTDKKDMQWTAEVKCYSTSADPTDAIGTLAAGIQFRIYKDYTNGMSFTATSYSGSTTGNNNEAADNVAWATRVSKSTPSNYNAEGFVVETSAFTMASNFEFTNAYGAEIEYDLGNNLNNLSTQNPAYTSLAAAAKIIILRKSSNSGGNESRVLNARVKNSHTSSPFNASSGNATYTIKNDVRAGFTAAFNPTSTGPASATTTKGYNFTDYNNQSHNKLDVTSSSENESSHAYDFDYVDNNGTITSTDESPSQVTLTTVKDYDIELVAVGTNSEIHHKASAADDDTEQKQDHVSILALPADPYLTTLAGQNLTLASPQGSDTSDYKLVSGAQTPYGSTTKNAGDVVVRTTTGYQDTNKTAYISAWPGNTDLACQIKAKVNGSDDGSKTFSTTPGDYGTGFTTGVNNGTVTSLVISDDEDGFNTSNIPKGLYRKFKAKVNSSSLTKGMNAYALQLIRGSGSTTTDTNTLEFCVDDNTSNPSVSAGYTVALNSAGTYLKVSGLDYIKSGGSTSLSISGFTTTNLFGQVYYDGTDVVQIENGTGTPVGTSVNKSLTQAGASTPVAADYNFNNVTFNVTMNPTTGKRTTGRLQIKAKNCNGTGSAQAATENIMYYTGTNTFDRADFGTMSLTNGTAVSGKTTIKRLTDFNDTSGTPSAGGTQSNDYDHYTNLPWGTTQTLGNYEALVRPNDSGTDEIIWDNTNWQTYLPATTSNPDRSSLGTGQKQYVTFAFCRAGLVSDTAFAIKIVGTFNQKLAGSSTVDGPEHIYCMIPGVSNATNVSQNGGWCDLNINYANIGSPGTGTAGNGSIGIRDVENPIGDSGANSGAINLNIGGFSTSATGNKSNQVIIRIGLEQNEKITGITIQDNVSN